MMDEPYDDSDTSLFDRETAEGFPDDVRIKNFEFVEDLQRDDYDRRQERFYDDVNRFLDQHEVYHVECDTDTIGVGNKYSREKWRVKDIHIFYREG